MNTSQEIALSIFREQPDPRVERTKVHSAEFIVFISLCTFLSGGDGFYDMEKYAIAKEDWLRKHVGMQSVPRHDTFIQALKVQMRLPWQNTRGGACFQS